MGAQRNANVRKLVRRSRAIRRGRLVLAAGKRPFRRGVGRAFENPALPYVADMSGSSRTLLIAFGGLQGELGMPVFEFFKSTRDIPVKRLFVRDLRQSWYHGGLAGDDATLTDATDSLRELVAREDVDRLVTVGNSAGGYAAMVFGTLLGADTVLSFSPQTVLDLGSWLAMKDGRWERQLRPLVEVDALDARWTDLRTALPRQRSADTRYEIFFDERHRLDRLHAERLAGVDGVRLYRFGRGGHMLSLSLRRSGGLDRLLRRALGHPATAHPLAAGA
jgi:hypothetical protein